ncbi:hypothetical protein BC332_17443 [Capsicum chinense]|nr:hypothetical protein BC332_17443 [Capsicum chinense]
MVCVYVGPPVPIAVECKLEWMDFENVMRLINRIFVQVQSRRNDQPAQLFEIIGNLEQLKAHFQSEVSDQELLSSLLTSQPVSQSPVQLVSNQATPITMDVEQPQATNIPSQPVSLISPPPRPFDRNPTLWQPFNESLYLVVSPPMLWFSTLIDSQRKKRRLKISQTNLANDHVQQKVKTLCIKAPPGLLVNASKKSVYPYWPALGKFFEDPSIGVNVLFQWKTLNDRYMFILYIDEDGPGSSGAGAGPSGTGPGPSGSGCRASRSMNTAQ